MKKIFVYLTLFTFFSGALSMAEEQLTMGDCISCLQVMSGIRPAIAEETDTGTRFQLAFTATTDYGVLIYEPDMDVLIERVHSNTSDNYHMYLNFMWYGEPNYFVRFFFGEFTDFKDTDVFVPKGAILQVRMLGKAAALGNTAASFFITGRTFP